MNYYNEFDSFAAQWLRSLIDAGLIPAGDVDERSIEDVSPVELMGYEQCHFFAGIGGWSLALQLAGWTGPAWTASCPCQPFSAAGKGLGTSDERHLWPVVARLISECGPSVVFGEQVASKAGREWLSGVRLDLEALGYGVGAADLCAAGVGAPHIRQRLYWVADSDSERCDGQRVLLRQEAPGRLTAQVFEAARSNCAGGVADSQHKRLQGRLPRREDSQRQDQYGCAGLGGPNSWDQYIWTPCADGKTRRIEPSIEPLAHGIPARVGRLRGYGNAIVPQLAAEFISAYMEVSA